MTDKPAHALAYHVQHTSSCLLETVPICIKLREGRLSVAHSLQRGAIVAAAMLFPHKAAHALKYAAFKELLAVDCSSFATRSARSACPLLPAYS